eukprot:gene34901-63673_t
MPPAPPPRTTAARTARVTPAAAARAAAASDASSAVAISAASASAVAGMQGAKLKVLMGFAVCDADDRGQRWAAPSPNAAQDEAARASMTNFFGIS